MPSFGRKSLIFCLTLLVSHSSFAQGRSSFRALLNRIHITTSIGIGGSQYSIKAVHRKGAVAGETILFSKEGDFYLYDGNPMEAYLVRWFNGSDIPVSFSEPLDLENLDKAKQRINFKGTSITLPLSLGAHVDLWRKLRIGLGGTLFISSLEKLEPEELYEYLGSYTPLEETHYCLCPFMYLGFKFLENSSLSLLVDSTIGLDYYTFIDSDIEDIFDQSRPNISIGFTVEGNVSEYLRLSSRLAYEQSGFFMFPSEKIGVVLERQSLLLQLGLSFSYPEVPRCPLAGCEIERKHKHGGEVYRGVSIFTNRDAQGRRIYKK